MSDLDSLCREGARFVFTEEQLSGKEIPGIDRKFTTEAWYDATFLYLKYVFLIINYSKLYASSSEGVAMRMSMRWTWHQQRDWYEALSSFNIDEPDPECALKMLKLPQDGFEFILPQYGTVKLSIRNVRYDGYDAAPWLLRKLLVFAKQVGIVLPLMAKTPQHSWNEWEFILGRYAFLPFQGWSLCFRDEDFPSDAKALLSAIGLDKTTGKPSGGRPPIHLEAAKLYWDHFPDGNVSLSAAAQRLGYDRKTLKTGLEKLKGMGK